MKKGIHKDLFDQNIIDQEEFRFLDLVSQRKVISVYYELRLLLYLGIMLFTCGIGYIVYQNMGEMLHIVLMSLLGVSIVASSYYINFKSKLYNHQSVNVEHFYFDYIVVLTALLLISLFTYVQVYFDLVELLIKWTSLISGVVFMMVAYRYDNKMVLSLGITALAAALGLSISPVGWTSGSNFDELNIYVLSVIFGTVLLGMGYLSTSKDIKKHFTFTYQNFGLLLVYFGLLALMFDTNNEVLMAFVTLLISGTLGWYTWKHKLFLFFLYSCITGYIAFTFLFIKLDIEWEFYIFYFPISCITAVVLLIKHKSHFSND
jgi:hypothetical protein